MARRSGDVAAMRATWEELVIAFYDRMDALIYLNHKGRLDDEEHEEAVQRAHIKFAKNLMTTFKGTSMGELVNATKTLCFGVCIDVQRDAERYRRSLHSFDAGWDTAGADDRAAPSWENDQAERNFDRDQRGADAADFIEWALPQLDDNKREVVEMTFHGATIAEICTELDLTRDNAYQLRSRGMRQLAKLYEQYGTI